MIAWDLSDNTRHALRDLYRKEEIRNTSNRVANRDALDKVAHSYFYKKFATHLITPHTEALSIR